MDSEKVGRLIRYLRKEKNMTQRTLASALHISDRAVSKWERGLGCPDISLVPGLSRILGISAENLLCGELQTNDNGGNMKRIQFYLCPVCGNVLYSTGDADVTCCGRKLQPLEPKPVDAEHAVNREEVENDYFLTLEHPMEKDHFISFAACATYDRVLLIKLYPEQNAEIRVPKLSRGTLYLCCGKHGLYDCGRL